MEVHLGVCGGGGEVGGRGGSSVSNENVTCITDLLRPSSDSKSLHV